MAGIKLQDGSLANAGELLMHGAEDTEGNLLNFQEISGALVPRFEAVLPDPTDRNQEKVYSFSLLDTSVRVAVSTREKARVQLMMEEPEAKAKAKTEPETFNKEPVGAAAPKTQKAYKTVNVISSPK